MPRRFSEINNEFERAVFMAVYNSQEQRRRRRLAKWVLVLKHALRGLLIIWPVFAVLGALMFLSLTANEWVYLLVLAPGVLAWFYIYLKGAHKDYKQCVHEQILEKGFIKNLILH